MTDTPGLKGHAFTAESPLIPLSIKQGPAEQLQAHIEAENRRWAIVKRCDICGEPLVAEELAAHRLAHVPDNLRAIARDLALFSPQDRLAIFSLFDLQSGELNGAE